MKAQITEDQVRALLRKGRESLDHKPSRVPFAVEQGARAGLEALEENSGDIAEVGTLVAAAGLSWWSAVDPFTDPPELLPTSGRAAALAGMSAAASALVEIEDRKRLALERLKRTALRVGLDAVSRAVPFLIRAFLSRDEDED